MTRNVIAISTGFVLLLAGLLAFFLFRTPQEASSPIQAVPLGTTVPVATSAAITSNPTAVPAATSDTSAAVPTTVAQPTTVVAPTSAPAATQAAPTTGSTIFEIVPAESEARFLIDEVLRGSPVTVVGTTDQVAGQMSIDPSNPAATQLGTIQVNARTLVTDNEFRNRAIKNAILSTDSYEFITFVPTGITGLPSSVAVNQPFTFQIAGDLTIKDTTKPVTFDVTVTPVSETKLNATAKTSVLYRDFALAIPDSPSVDTVADEVRIELDIVAQASGS